MYERCWENSRYHSWVSSSAVFVWKGGIWVIVLKSVYVSSILTFWLFCRTSDSFYRRCGIAQPMDAPTKVTRWGGRLNIIALSIAFVIWWGQAQLNIWTCSSSKKVCIWRYCMFSRELLFSCSVHTVHVQATMRGNKYWYWYGRVWRWCGRVWRWCGRACRIGTCLLTGSGSQMKADWWYSSLCLFNVMFWLKQSLTCWTLFSLLHRSLLHSFVLVCTSERVSRLFFCSSQQNQRHKTH